MTTAALLVLAAAAAVGAGLWYGIDRLRHDAPAPLTAIAAAAPALLLGAAALLALAADPAGVVEHRIAAALAVAAAIPGGALAATACLRLAGRVRRPANPATEGPAPKSPEAPDSATTSAPGSPTTPVSAAPAAPTSDPIPAPLATQLPLPPPVYAVSDPDTLRGGTMIGVLERVGVVVTLLAGWPEGLALILAVKGFGRYPELRKPSAPERFIIGTFASILWAVAAAGVATALRH